MLILFKNVQVNEQLKTKDVLKSKQAHGLKYTVSKNDISMKFKVNNYWLEKVKQKRKN